MKHAPVPKAEAIRRLRMAGLKLEAEQLNAWRAANRQDWGWDGWIRKAHPRAIPVIWPQEDGRR